MLWITVLATNQLLHGYQLTCRHARPETFMQLMWPLLQDVVNSLYKCVMSRLMAQDQDQEVKDCAISCMAAAVSQLGDVITPQLPQVLQVTRTFWSCRQQPLMGLQSGHPHLL